MKEKRYTEIKFYDGKTHVNSIHFEYDLTHYTKTELLKRGWTVALIDELLGQADKEYQNKYKKTVRLFERKRVLEAENSDTFLTKRKRKK